MTYSLLQSVERRRNMLEAQFSATPDQCLEKSRLELSVFRHWYRNMNADTVQMRRFTLRFADSEKIPYG